MWHIVIQCVSDDGLKTKLKREVDSEEPRQIDIDCWEKYYTTQQWTATVISVFGTADGED